MKLAIDVVKREFATVREIHGDASTGRYVFNAANGNGIFYACWFSIVVELSIDEIHGIE